MVIPTGFKSHRVIGMAGVFQSLQDRAAQRSIKAGLEQQTWRMMFCVCIVA